MHDAKLAAAAGPMDDPAVDHMTHQAPAHQAREVSLNTSATSAGSRWLGARARDCRFHDAPLISRPLAALPRQI